jgi:hypothetical protein
LAVAFGIRSFAGTGKQLFCAGFGPKGFCRDWSILLEKIFQQLKFAAGTKILRFP